MYIYFLSERQPSTLKAIQYETKKMSKLNTLKSKAAIERPAGIVSKDCVVNVPSKASVVMHNGLRSHSTRSKNFRQDNSKATQDMLMNIHIKL